MMLRKLKTFLCMFFAYEMAYFIYFYFSISGSDMCPVKIYKLFRSHRPIDGLKEDARMYLQPLRKPKDDVWFSCQPLGKNTIGNIVRNMYKNAGIGGRHTNHSARRTMIRSVLEEGVHETRLMQVHKMFLLSIVCIKHIWLFYQTDQVYINIFGKIFQQNIINIKD